MIETLKYYGYAKISRSRRKRLWRVRRTLRNKLNRNPFICGVTMERTEEEIRIISRDLKRGFEIVFKK